MNNRPAKSSRRRATTRCHMTLVVTYATDSPLAAAAQMRGPTSFVNALAQAYLSSSLQTPIMLSTSRLASSRAIVVPIHGISSSRANIAVRRRIIQRCRSTRSGSPPLSSATLHIAAGVAGGGVVILGVSTLRPPHVVDRDAPKSSQYSQYRVCIVPLFWPKIPRQYRASGT